MRDNVLGCHYIVHQIRPALLLYDGCPIGWGRGSRALQLPLIHPENVLQPRPILASVRFSSGI